MGASLDEDAVPGRRRERRHDRHGRGDHQGARAGDDEEHQRAIEPHRCIASGDEGRDNRDDRGERDDRRCIDACEAIDERLDRRAASLCGLHQVDDAGEACVASDPDHLEIERAAAIDGARIELVARPLVHGKRFTRYRRLVHVPVSGQNATIERNLVAGPYDDLGAHVNGLDWRAVLDAIPPDDGLTRR